MGVFCANETVFLTPGTTLVLVCNTSIRDGIVNPTWWGPPKTTKYNTQSRLFNPQLGEKLNRLNYTNNNIDLKLDHVTILDAGLYRCEVISQNRTYFYEIEVRGKYKYISLNSTSDLF